MEQFGTPFSINSLRPGTSPVVIITADRWEMVTFRKETSGAVAIGTSSGITAVSGGGGIILQAGTTEKFLLSPGTKIWAVGSTAAEVVSYSELLMDMIPFLLNKLVELAAGEPVPVTRIDTYKYPGQ